VFSFALALALQALVPPAPAAISTDTTLGRRAAADTVLQMDRFVPSVAALDPAAFALVAPRLNDTTLIPQLVEYSELYGVRAGIHRAMSWAMIPLFVGSAYTGFQLRSKGDAAPKWTRDLHGPVAGATAVLFGMNTLTGVWNLIEGRKDPEGRGKRIVHGVMFLAAGAGFAYVTAAGDNIRSTGRSNHWHRDIALGAMAVSVTSWALMALFK
jgi:hypothetical protein